MCWSNVIQVHHHAYSAALYDSLFLVPVVNHAQERMTECLVLCNQASYGCCLLVIAPLLSVLLFFVDGGGGDGDVLRFLDEMTVVVVCLSVLRSFSTSLERATHNFDF